MGETPAAIARRFGYTRPASLSRRMRRYGRVDLARLVEREADYLPLILHRIERAQVPLDFTEATE